MNWNDLQKACIDIESAQTTIKNVLMLEDTMLQKIVSEKIGRPATNEDAKRLSKVQQYGSYDVDCTISYQLAFDGEIIGQIKKCYNKYRYSIEFIPKE